MEQISDYKNLHQGKKLFILASGPSLSDLDLCLTMQDERVFCTNIDDLSASGFGCRIKGLARLHRKQTIMALFVLPIKEPVSPNPKFFWFQS